MPLKVFDRDNADQFSYDKCIFVNFLSAHGLHSTSLMSLCACMVLERVRKEKKLYRYYCGKKKKFKGWSQYDVVMNYLGKHLAPGRWQLCTCCTVVVCTQIYCVAGQCENWLGSRHRAKIFLSCVPVQSCPSPKH